MKKVNMHGLNINSLEKAAKATENGSRRYNLHMQINYDSDTGEAWASGPLTDGDYVAFDDPAIFAVCDAYDSMTAQEIANRIAEAVEDRAAYAAYLATLA